MHSAHLFPANVAGVLEGVSQHALRRLAGDELDALHHTINHDVLNARVFSLSVLSDQHGVDVVVGRLVAGDGSAWAHVGEEVEGSAECQVEGHVALADGCCERALERDQVLCDAVDGLVGDDRLAVRVQARGDVDRLPLDGDICGRVDVLDRLRDLRANAVALNQSNAVLAVVALGALELGYFFGVGADGGLVYLSAPAFKLQVAIGDSCGAA